MESTPPRPSAYARFWPLDHRSVFLNHGSFGACPVYILDKQAKYRQQLESQPVRFFVREMEELLNQSRTEVARFVNASPDDLVFVQNATAGVNTVFQSLKFKPGDEILYTSHIYGACERLLEFIADQTGAKLVKAEYGFPIDSHDVILNAILEKVTSHTRIALVDHITSATALIHPVQIIVKELEKRGIDTLVDGAHSLGSIPLDLKETGAAYYTANCHKWLCSPKSVAILHVRRDKQNGMVPVVISHAGHKAEPFAERFFWPGTIDPTAALCVTDSLRYMPTLVRGGWPVIMKRNHDLCLEAREMICNALEIPKPCPDSMIASMAAFPLPGSSTEMQTDYKSISQLQENLFSKYNIEVPVWNCASPPFRIIRISVQLYNSMDQYRYFTAALTEALNE